MNFNLLEEYECLEFIRQNVNDENVSDIILKFRGHENSEFLLAKLNEIKDVNLINICIDRDPLKVKLTDDRVINLTGQSGSGKSYFSNSFDDNYLIVDTDELLSEHRYKNSVGINKELGEYFRTKYDVLPDLANDFDLIYDEILSYCKKYNKWIVIDCAQFHCINDISKLKGIVIIMRTCIDTCYKRCIERYKKNNSSCTEEELSDYMLKKKKIYKWYRGSNEFIRKVIEIGSEINE